MYLFDTIRFREHVEIVVLPCLLRRRFRHFETFLFIHVLLKNSLEIFLFCFFFVSLNKFLYDIYVESITYLFQSVFSSLHFERVLERGEKRRYFDVFFFREKSTKYISIYVRFISLILNVFMDFINVSDSFQS